MLLCCIFFKASPCNSYSGKATHSLHSLSYLFKPMDDLLKLMMVLDCGLRCEGLGSNFLQQSKRCDFMCVLECLVSVPHSTALTGNNSN